MSARQDQPPGASQTQVRMATTDDLHTLSCDVQRSVRYHRARERFFASWSNWFSFLSLVAGSSVVVALLASAPNWVAVAAGVVVVVTQALEQVFRLSSKTRDHSSLANEFLALERILTLKGQLTEQDLRDLRAEVLSIEAREPPIKRYLDLICHNQVARAIGSDDLEPLKWWQRFLAQYLNGDGALQRET